MAWTVDDSTPGRVVLTNTTPDETQPICTATYDEATTPRWTLTAAFLLAAEADEVDAATVAEQARAALDVAE